MDYLNSEPAFQKPADDFFWGSLDFSEQDVGMPAEALRELPSIPTTGSIKVKSRQRSSILGRSSSFKRLSQALFKKKAKARNVSTKSNQSEQNYAESKINPSAIIRVILKAEHRVLYSLLEDAFKKEVTNDFWDSILFAFLEQHSFLPLLKFCFTSELENHPKNQQTTVLREESVATKLMSRFLTKKGQAYLELLLYPLIQFVSSVSSFLVLDPFSEQGQPATQDMDLIDLTQLFLDSVFESLDLCPITFRIICAHIHSEVSRLFPVLQPSQIMSSLFCLRYLCPAIVSPHIYTTLLDNEPITIVEIQRPLVYISKLVQSLANSSNSPSRDFTAPVSAFLEGNSSRLQEFIRRMMDEPSLYDLQCGVRVLTQEDIPT